MYYFSEEDFRFISEYYDFIFDNKNLKLKKRLKQETKNIAFENFKYKINSKLIRIDVDEYYNYYFFRFDNNLKLKIKKLNLTLIDFEKRIYIIINYLKVDENIKTILLKKIEDARKKNSDGVKRACQTEENKLKRKEYNNNPQTKLRKSNQQKELWKSEEFRKKQSSEKNNKIKSNSRKKWFNNKENYKLFLSWMQNPERIKKISNAAKKMWKDAKDNNDINKINKMLWNNFSNKRKYKIQNKLATHPEYIFSKILEDLNVEFLYEDVLYKNDKIIKPDFLLKNQNIIFEIYGDYWHVTDYYLINKKLKLEEIYINGRSGEEIRKNDNERIENLKSLNYKIYIIYEHELYKNNLNNLREKINENIKC
jgi:G:T-mismatch repair DNA endonuclease (very short patch repair protein)